MRLKLGGCGVSSSVSARTKALSSGLAREKIEAALEADRRAGLLAHPPAAAERPADVTRPRLREIVELEELASE